MLDQQLTRVRHILNHWRKGVSAKPAPEMELSRSTQPEAPMNLLLRFETRNGPRTIITPKVPLKLASEIADEMIAAGHHAAFIDHLPSLTVAERISRLKLHGVVVSLPSRRAAGEN